MKDRVGNSYLFVIGIPEGDRDSEEAISEEIIYSRAFFRKKKKKDTNPQIPETQNIFLFLPLGIFTPKCIIVVKEARG